MQLVVELCRCLFSMEIVHLIKFDSNVKQQANPLCYFFDEQNSNDFDANSGHFSYFEGKFADPDHYVHFIHPLCLVFYKNSSKELKANAFAPV